MKPFDLEQALSGKPVISREGLPVRILATDLNKPNCPMAVAVMNQTGLDDVFVYSLDGKWGLVKSPHDLFMKEVNENNTLTNDTEGEWVKSSKDISFGYDESTKGDLIALNKDRNRILSVIASTLYDISQTLEGKL